MFVVQIIFSAHKVHQISKISNDLEVVWESIFHVFVCTYKFFLKTFRYWYILTCIPWGLVTEQFVGAKGTGNSFKHVKHSAFHPAWVYLP